MILSLKLVTGIKIVYRELSYEETADRLASAGTPPFLVVDMVESFKFIRDYGCESASRIITPSCHCLIYFVVFGGKTHSSHAGLARQPHTWADFVKTTDWAKVFENKG
jgi:hypothetical protein